MLPSYRNQSIAGFYMRATLAFNGLSELTFIHPEIIKKPWVFWLCQKEWKLINSLNIRSEIREDS